MAKHSRRHDATAARAEEAATLLASGAPRTVCVSQLAARHGVSRRTAQRWVALGAQQLRAEIGSEPLDAMLASSVERLQRLAHTCEAGGNLSAAVGAEKAASAVLVALCRLDAVAVGHTLAVAESGASDAERRKYRRSIRASPEPPF